MSLRGAWFKDRRHIDIKHHVDISPPVGTSRLVFYRLAYCPSLPPPALTIESWKTHCDISWIGYERRQVGGKVPDETCRGVPRLTLIRQGLHPHPGPTIYDCGFNDPDGGDWEGLGHDPSDGEADNEEVEAPEWTNGQLQHEEWECHTGHASSTLSGGLAQQGLEEIAWNVLMQPPAVNVELRNYLSEIGCPYEVCDVKPNLKHKVWGSPDAEEEEERVPALVGDSDDEELWLVPDNAVDEGADPDHDTDEELGFVDWYDARHGRCRGEMERVLGTEAWCGDRVAWALNTSNGTMEVDPSIHKEDRSAYADPAAGEVDVLPLTRQIGRASCQR